MGATMKNREPSPEAVAEMRRRLREDRTARKSNPKLPAFAVRNDEVTTLIRAAAADTRECVDEALKGSG